MWDHLGPWWSTPPEISGLLDAAAKEHEKCRADCEELQAQIPVDSTHSMRLRVGIGIDD